MKSKPLVSIYQRHQAKGVALYLHYTVNGHQYREATNLRLTGNKDTDKKVMAAAVILQAERTADILGGRVGVAMNNQRSKMLFTTFAEETATAKYKDDRRGTKKNYYTLISHLNNFKPKARVCDVNKGYCKAFVEYLANCGIEGTTQKHYFTMFGVIINRAVKLGLLQRNEAANLENKPKARAAERVYLNESEIRAFAATPPTDTEKETKRAFLFSFFTGLRYSDIKRLTPSNFEQTNEGLKFRIDTKKTGKYISFVVPDEAAAIVADDLNKTGFIFNVPAPSLTERRLREICARAGIDKRVTFHTARHTFATMLLTKGADIYTISTMLGHSSINTTAIYAKIVDKKKDSAAKLLGGVL